MRRVVAVALVTAFFVSALAVPAEARDLVRLRLPGISVEI